MALEARNLPPLSGQPLLEPLFRSGAIPVGANAGLVFDRYMKLWPRNLDDIGQRLEPVNSSVLEFVAAYNRHIGPHNPQIEVWLKEIHRRLGPPVSSWEWDFECTERFVSGLGADHPLENGFTFDRSLGVPLIPGSSIKGLCRAQAVLEGMDWGQIDELFGSDTEDNSARPGVVTFFPAYPRKWPELVMDIVNCHHRDYYGYSGRGAPPMPLETDSPIPVYFVAVEKAEFVFRLRSENDTLLERTKRLLRDGLECLGIGAKTAVGYGRMRPKGSLEIRDVAPSFSAPKPRPIERLDEVAVDRKLTFASVLLSFAPSDKALALAVADSLAPRGVMAWLDSSEPDSDMGLPEDIEPALRTTIRAGQGTAQDLAKRIARQVIQAQLSLPTASDITIVIDQRGDGERKGLYPLPEVLRQLGTPVLTFRPDLAVRSRQETLIGERWIGLRRTLEESLSLVLNRSRAPRTVRLVGDAQLGLGYWMGHFLNRTSGVALHTYHSRFEGVFTNAGLDRIEPIKWGNPHSETTQKQDKAAPGPIKEGEKYPDLAVYVGTEPYLAPVQQHLANQREVLPLVWVKTARFDTSPQVIQMVADVVALLGRLQIEHGTRQVQLFTSLPITAVSLLASELTGHATPEVQFMEYVLAGPDKGYHLLPMDSDQDRFALL